MQESLCHTPHSGDLEGHECTGSLGGQCREVGFAGRDSQVAQTIASSLMYLGTNQCCLVVPKCCKMPQAFTDTT